MNFKLADIIAVTHAETFGIATETVIMGVYTDSRVVLQGSVFVALSGEHFDGKDYALSAVEKGAAVIIVNDKTGLPLDKLLLVKNTRHALLAIAGLYRQTLGTKVVGVTGSVGKTTTKEMIACVLGRAGKTLKTKANLNNEVGLSQMLLELDNSYKFAVLELGVDGPSQMELMTKAAKPDIAVVTNIGTSHLEAFGTKEAIKKEKLSIKDGLTNDGIVILNGDDNYLKDEVAIFYGVESCDLDFKAEDINYENYSTNFTLNHRGELYRAEIPVSGKHNVLNALSAIAVGYSLGISIEKAILALKDYKTEGMRQKLVEVRGFTIVEDCYNANPQSMAAAIETLGLMNIEGRKIAVLSDMLELGVDEIAYHQEVGKLIIKNKIDQLYATGKLSKYMVELIINEGYDNAFYFESKVELAKALKKELRAGDIAWLKASRGMKLEEVLKEIY